jgi:Spy/CpxP family protein refolding chaperone
MNEPVSSIPSPPRPPRARRAWLVAGVAISILTLAVGTSALVFANGGGWHHHGWGDSMTPEQIAGQIEHGVKYMLSDVDATADQKTKVTAILQAAANDVHSLHDQHMADHTQLQAILSAQTIDRAQLETIRATEMQLADQASKRIVTAIADAAEVLTQEQRTKLVAEMQKHHHGMHSGDSISSGQQPGDLQPNGTH